MICTVSILKVDVPVSTNSSRGTDEQQKTPFEGVSARPHPVSVTDDQQLATLAHMLGFAGCLPSLLIHRWSRGRARFTQQESLEAANFTFGPTLIVIACALLAFVPYVGWAFALIGAATWLVLAVFSVIAAVTVNKGRPYVYRFNWYLYDLVTRHRAERRKARQESGPIDATGEITAVRPGQRTQDTNER